jgi:cadmium resistance protein CadD (predicted permease)
VILAALGTFAATNVDDILILALFFGRAAGHDHAPRQVVIGQYLGFALILAVSVAGALGATRLSESAIAYLGLLPIALGVRAAVLAWQHRDAVDEERETRGVPSIGSVATVTFANGGDNIGVYVPVFAAAGVGGLSIYVAVFLLMVGVWCFLGHHLATRPVIARALSRWGHILLPIVLIAIGTLILVRGGAFGL